MKKRPKVGLALGSGGAKGYAHVGVLQSLIKNQIPIDFIAGSSVGALAASLYALFLDGEKIKNISLSNNWNKIIFSFDFSLNGGLMQGVKFQSFLNKVLEKANFKETKIPLKVIATDLETAQAVEIEKGNIALAVRASCSVPLIFKSVKIGNKFFGDGGLSDPVPVQTVKKMGADIVIAVNLDNANYFEQNKLVIDKKGITGFSLVRYLNYFQYHLANRSCQGADILIEPKVSYLRLRDWPKLVKNGGGREFIREGEKSTRLALPHIKKLLKQQIYGK